MAGFYQGCVMCNAIKIALILILVAAVSVLLVQRFIVFLNKRTEKRRHRQMQLVFDEMREKVRSEKMAMSYDGRWAPGDKEKCQELSRAVEWSPPTSTGTSRPTSRVVNRNDDSSGSSCDSSSSSSSGD